MAPALGQAPSQRFLWATKIHQARQHQSESFEVFMFGGHAGLFRPLLRTRPRICFAVRAVWYCCVVSFPVSFSKISFLFSTDFPALSGKRNGFAKTAFLPKFHHLIDQNSWVCFQRLILLLGLSASPVFCSCCARHL